MAGNYGTFHLYMPQLTWNWFLIVAVPCITQQLGCIWHLLRSRVDSVPALCSCVFIETIMQNVSFTQSLCTSSRPQLVLAVVSMKHHPQEAPPTRIRSFWKSTILPTPYSTLTGGYVIALTILYMLCHMASDDFGVNVTWLSTALRFEVQGRNQLNTHTVWYCITWPSVDVTWPS